MKQLYKKPLADRMRPNSLAEFFGQEEIIGESKLLFKAIESDQIPSIIFWGPPGTGKTTLAHIIAKQTNSKFLKLSAVTTGVKEAQGENEEILFAGDWIKSNINFDQNFKKRKFKIF